MRLGIPPQRLIQKLDPTTSPLELFQQHHLLDIITGESIRARDDDTLDRRLFDAVLSRSKPGRLGVAPRYPSSRKISSDRSVSLLCVYMGGEPLDLLFNRLSEGLPLGRHPGIDRGAHALPPPVVRDEAARRTARSVVPIARRYWYT